jgi:hypothetical protein
MTPQEQQMLQDLANRINQTVLQDKDPEAEQFLTQSLSRNPDAVYILAQTVLVQRYALDQAKKQLDEAKQAAQQAPPPPPAPVHHTSFLGSLLGTAEPERPAPPPPQTQYAPVNYAPAPAYQQPQYGQPQYVQPSYGAPAYGAPSGGGGFLRGAMQTATGVAAGALAFEGVESLMHGFGEHAGYGAGSGFGGMGGGQPREEIINNYYGDSDRDRGGISPDIEDRRDENRDSFASSGNDDYTTNDPDTGGDVDYGTDNSSDDSSSDDNSDPDYGSDDSNS